MRRYLTSVMCALTLVLSGAADAGVIKFFNNGNLTSYMNNAMTFYNAQSGITATSTTAAVSGAELAGVDLMFGWERTTSYSGAEISAMSAFLAGGGRIAFWGEHGGFATENSVINAALSSLGSSMSIIGNVLDGGFHVATVANGQILAHGLTAGVNSLHYAASSGISGVSGGNSLFLDTSHSFTWASFDPLAGDGIVVVTDVNIADSVSQLNGPHNNGQFFLNLLNAQTANVPLPGALALLCCGLLAIGFARRRAA